MANRKPGLMALVRDLAAIIGVNGLRSCWPQPWLATRDDAIGVGYQSPHKKLHCCSTPHCTDPSTESPKNNSGRRAGPDECSFIR